jgi:hypothetical protein
MGVIVSACCQCNPYHLTKRDRVSGRVLDRKISINSGGVGVIPVNRQVAGAVELNHPEAAGWIATYRDSVVDRPD